VRRLAIQAGAESNGLSFWVCARDIFLIVRRLAIQAGAESEGLSFGCVLGLAHVLVVSMSGWNI